MNFKKRLCIVLAAIFIASAFSLPTFAKKKSGISKRPTKASIGKKGKKRGHRGVRIRGSTDDTIPLSAQNMAIPENVVEALASGDISNAIITMREARTTPKLLYLIREASRIYDYQSGIKVEKSGAHKFYQNVAIAYHNLYLFLRTRDIEQKDFFDSAIERYKKAKSSGSTRHKQECDVLSAAIIAASGDVNSAKKIFSKVKTPALRDDFESMEYLASYYAAVGDTEGAIKALEEAYKKNPDTLLTWFSLGDDFVNISGKPEFKSLLVTWKAAEVAKRLSQNMPKEAYQKTDTGEGSFRPQKSGRHYDIKKSKKLKVSKKAKSSDKKKSGKKKK